MDLLIRIIKFLVKFSVESVVVLLSPTTMENRIDQRRAWAYFIFPVFFVGGVGVIVAVSIMVAFGHPLDWMLTGLWLFYFWLCEPVMYYIEGDGFERWNRWINDDGKEGA